MKTITNILFVITFLMANFNANAVVRTVSNWSAIPAQYTSVQDAIEEANANDIIYVHGSPNSYGDITIWKKLTIIGAGFYPSGQNQNRSTFQSINLSPRVLAGIDNSSLIGISAANIYYQVPIQYGFDDTVYDVKGITIDRSFFSYLSAFLGSGTNNNSFLIKNSFINGLISLNAVTDVTIANNYFIGSSSIDGANSPAINAVISQNAFIGGFYGANSSTGTICNTAGQNSGNAIGILNNAIFTNNIFYGVPLNPILSNTVFNNNLTFATNNDALSFSGAITTGTISSNPNFIQIENPLTADCFFYGGIGFDLRNVVYYFNQINLTLATGSPAINSGIGGVNIGPSGGSLGFNYRTQSRPRIPQMQSLVINNAAIQQDGTLNVQIQGQKQD